MPYLDTSVLTAYYCREARTQHVQRILWDVEEPAISPLGEVEFHCVVARKVRSGTMERAAALRVISEFKLHLGEPRYKMVPIQTMHYGLASGWIARLVTSLRVLDALHLAAVAHHRVQYLLTWNCKHIANAKILPRIHGALTDFGIPIPIICTPEELLGDDAETD